MACVTQDFRHVLPDTSRTQARSRREGSPARLANCRCCGSPGSAASVVCACAYVRAPFLAIRAVQSKGTPTIRDLSRHRTLRFLHQSHSKIFLSYSFPCFPLFLTLTEKNPHPIDGTTGDAKQRPWRTRRKPNSRRGPGRPLRRFGRSRRRRWWGSNSHSCRARLLVVVLVAVPGSRRRLVSVWVSIPQPGFPLFHGLIFPSGRRIHPGGCNLCTRLGRPISLHFHPIRRRSHVCIPPSHRAPLSRSAPRHGPASMICHCCRIPAGPVQDTSPG